MSVRSMKLHGVVLLSQSACLRVRVRIHLENFHITCPHRPHTHTHRTTNSHPSTLSTVPALAVDF